jgi:hypothetical protein
MKNATTRLKIGSVLLLMSLLISGCGGGSYGTGIDRNFRSLEIEKEPEAKDEQVSLPWFMTGPSCAIGNFKLRISTEFGKVGNSVTESFCSIVVPSQAKNIRVEIISRENLPSAANFSLETTECDSAKKVLESNGSLAIVKETLILPSLNLKSNQVAKFKVELSKQLIEIKVKRDDGVCR